MTNFSKIDTIYIKVIALIFVVIVVVIIIIANVAIPFLLWNFSSYSMIYASVGSIRDPLKQDLALDFYRKQVHKHFNWNSYQTWSNTLYKK